MATDPLFWRSATHAAAPLPCQPRLYLTRDANAIPAVQLHALLQDSYWARGIPLATVERALNQSLCLAVMHRNNGHGAQLLAFARAVTDGATFAWICDVVVHPEWRGNGLGKQVVRELLAQPELQGLRRLLLATADAHGLYQRHGFTELKAPERWLELHNPAVYQTHTTNQPNDAPASPPTTAPTHHATQTEITA